MGVFDCVPANGRISSTTSTEVFNINKSSSSLNNTTRDVESQQQQTVPVKHSIWWKLAIDLPLLLIVLILLGLYELGVIPSYKAGFYCNDPALSFKFRGDTISMAFIMISVLLFPFAIIWITELTFSESDTLKSRAMKALSVTGVLFRNYLYGFFFNLGIIEVMKGLTGSPRPTFFDICEPDTGKTCYGTRYVSEFQCTSTKYSNWFQMDSYHSFPSGHTSLSVYCGLFTAWYLQRRAFSWHGRTVFLVPVIQLLCLSYSAVCSLTRITDHRHHWWDVLTGSMIGVATVLYAVLVMSNNFSTLKLKRNDKRSSTKVNRPSVRSVT